jgi:hypothetical protein
LVLALKSTLRVAGIRAAHSFPIVFLINESGVSFGRLTECTAPVRFCHITMRGFEAKNLGYPKTFQL